MFALKKLRARRRPGNQAHVTNLKENPALLAADAAEAAARGFAEIETTVGVSRYAPLNAIAILVGSQTGRPGVMTQCAVEERRNLQLGDPGARHLRGDALRLRNRARLRRRRRHALVEGVPRVRVRLARRQGALHVGRGLRGADGTRAGQVDALPRGALPRRRSARPARRASRTARSRVVALALSRPRRHARDPRRERDRGLARPRGRLGQRRDRLALGDPQDGEADGPVPARHGFRHLGLLGHAAPRQHVRRRQLRRRRPRRVADDPARLAGRRRDRAARGGRGRGDPRAGGARDPGGVRRARLPARDRREVEAATYGYASDDLPDRDRAADVEAGDRVFEEEISGVDVARVARPSAVSATSPRRCSGCSASGSLPTTCRRPR